MKPSDEIREHVMKKRIKPAKERGIATLSLGARHRSWKGLTVFFLVCGLAYLIR
jgi:hypothetical protein